MGKFATFAMADDGATAIEYGLIGALLAVACIAAFTFFGGSLAGLFNEVDARAGDAMDNAGV
jgi:pilus assembly protein Flp/PilA